MKKGRFYGVSVGPGDPELLTLKGKRIIEDCPVMAVPVTGKGTSVALHIVEKAMDISEKAILTLTFMMTTDENILEENHKREAMRVIELLDKGIDVAMLNLGDVSIYSTFGCLHKIIGEAGYETEMVPGVPSFCCAAAVLKTSLAAGKEPLHIIPSGCESLESSLSLEGTKVLMKIGSGLPQVKSMLREKGLVDKASLVVNCGFPQQRVYENMEDAADYEGYFAIIVVKE